MKRLENASPIRFSIGEKEITINPSEILVISDDPLDDMKFVAHNYSVVGSYLAALRASREQDRNSLEARRAQLYHQLKSGGYERLYRIAKMTEDAIEHALNDDEQVRTLKALITRQGVVIDQLFDLKKSLEMNLESLRETVQSWRQERKIDAKSPHS